MYISFILTYLIELWEVEAMSHADIFGYVIEQYFDREVCILLRDTVSNDNIWQTIFSSNKNVVILSNFERSGDLNSCEGFIIGVEDYTLLLEKYTYEYLPPILTIFNHDRPIISEVSSWYSHRLLNLIGVEVLEQQLRTQFGKLYQNYLVTVYNLDQIQKPSVWNQVEEPKTAELKPRLRQNLTIRICYIQSPPFTCLDKENRLIDGVQVPVFKEATKDLQVIYKLIEEPEDQLIWDSELDALTKNVCDVAAGGQWHRVFSPAVEYTYPDSHFCLTFLVKKPLLLPQTSFVTTHFGTAVMLYLGVMSCILLTFRIIKRVMTDTRVFEDLTDVFNIITLQSDKSTHIWVSSRCLLLFWLIFRLLFPIYCSAGITGSLAKPNFYKNIDSFADMVREQVIWTSNSNIYRGYMEESIDETIWALAKLNVRGDEILDRTEDSAILVKVISDAYLINLDRLPKEDQKYYKLLRECVNKYYSGFAVNKRSPFKGLFDYATLRLTEAGIVNQLFKEMFTKVASQLDNTFRGNYVARSAIETMTLWQLSGAFVSLLFGFGISSVVLLLELTLSKLTKKQYIYGNAVSVKH